MDSLILEKVQRVFNDIDAANREIAQKTGLKCLSGCGACCLSPKVTAMPIECLPLAKSLLERYIDTEGLLEDLFLHAEAETSCQFYNPNPFEPSIGNCTVYFDRPSLCRIFGSSARREKNGSISLILCKTQKERLEIPESVAPDAEISCSQSFGLALRALAPGSWLTEEVPINRAVYLAVAYMANDRSLANPVDKVDATAKITSRPT